MILIDECEYRETKKRIGELKLGLASLEAAGPGGGVAEYEGKRSAYVRLIGDLERQAAEFEEARSGRLAEIRCEGFGELAGGPSPGASRARADARPVGGNARVGS